MWLIKRNKNDQWTVFLDYVNKNFGVTMNGEKMSLKLNKFEFEGSDYTETLNIVLMGKPLKQSGDVFIKNTILFDAIDGQMNVTSAKIGETETLTFKKTPKNKVGKTI